MLITRMNDSGYGYCFICKCPVTTTNLVGSANVLVNSLPAMRFNDMVQGSCGHVGNIIAISKNVINHLPIAKMGDLFTGIIIGNISTGSTNVISQ